MIKAKFLRLLVCGLLTLTLAVSLTACGSESTNEFESTSSSAPTEEPKSEEQDAQALALEQYLEIVANATSYDYGLESDLMAGVFHYAVETVDAGYEVPALFLKQDGNNGVAQVLVFQYDPASGEVIHPTGQLSEGVGSVGGFRGGLAVMADGNGLLYSTVQSGNGATELNRVTIDEASNSLQIENLWSGTLGDQSTPQFETVDITWYNTNDLVALGGETVAPATEDTQAEDAALPTDGDRIVLSGTVGRYSHSEMVEMQGLDSDPYPDYGETLTVIMLDQGTDLTIKSGDGMSMWTHHATMMLAQESPEVDALVGQHIIFSVDPQLTYWPSDVRLPMGEPGTNNINILS